MTTLLVPGFMLDADMWRDLEDAMPGLGPYRHVETGLDRSIPAMAQRACADAPPSFLLIGFSMGGYIARDIVRMVPDRVSGLVLIATSARGDTPEQVRRKADRAQQPTGFAGLSRSAVASSLHPDHAGDAPLIARLQSMAARLGGDVFSRQCMLPRPGDLDRLGEIRCPTLVLAGERDGLRSLEETRELQAGIEGSKLAVVEGTGHMLPLEAPERVAEAITGWLAEEGLLPRVR